MVTLRLAVSADRDHLFYWRKDPVSRLNSMTQEDINQVDHLQWFTEKLNDPNVRFYIAETSQAIVGTTRLQILDDEAEVSITVAPRHRGHGYARQILAAVEEQARKVGLRSLIAQIWVQNLRSLAAFIQEGYVPVEISPAEGRAWMWLRKIIAS